MPQLTHAQPVKGLGMVANAEGHELLVGNRKLLESHGVQLPTQAEEDWKAAQIRGMTTVLVALDGTPAMLLSVADALKPDAAESMSALKNLGVKRLVMLTGDNESTAQAVAGQIGISEFHGDLLPQDKVAFLRKLQQEGHVVTFVGDGINDSPALATADTGIAMGSGTDVAIDSSDVVLIRSELASLPRALKTAKGTVGVMYQNIAIAVGTVLLLLAGLFAGYIHMSIGMLIHEASILVVIFNAMRLIIRKKGN